MERESQAKNLNVSQQFGTNKNYLNVLKQFGEGNQILDATRDLNFQIFQQLNFIMRELNLDITLILKAKHRERKSNLDPMQELIFRDKAKRGEHKPDLDPMQDLIFTMYRWVLSKQNLLFFTQASCVILDNCQAIQDLIFGNPIDEQSTGVAVGTGYILWLYFNEVVFIVFLFFYFIFYF